VALSKAWTVQETGTTDAGLPIRAMGIKIAAGRRSSVKYEYFVTGSNGKLVKVGWSASLADHQADWPMARTGLVKVAADRWVRSAFCPACGKLVQNVAPTKGDTPGAGEWSHMDYTPAPAPETGQPAEQAPVKAELV
jgi:hypothetical protein